MNRMYYCNSRFILNVHNTSGFSCILFLGFFCLASVLTYYIMMLWYLVQIETANSCFHKALCIYSERISNFVPSDAATLCTVISHSVLHVNLQSDHAHLRGKQAAFPSSDSIGSGFGKNLDFHRIATEESCPKRGQRVVS